ncbi:MAG TPA: amino acid adenylation domain-containing protein [Anaerolineaceae bacterium]|nr:amino acid adenylation domain-containing protein [Anaerolineaceae bacterium]
MKNVEDFYPLSPMQQGMLFHSLYAPQSGVYHEQVYCRLDGELDVPAFEHAWQKVIDRHAILRTNFLIRSVKEPVQVVQKMAALTLEEKDWTGLSPDEQEASLQAFIAEDQRCGFDLTKAPLMRLALMRIASQAYQFVWSFHHILLDGWSVPLLLQEVLYQYESIRRGNPVNLPPVQPYRDYILWLRRQSLSDAEAFWRQKLQGFTVPTPIRTEHSQDRSRREITAGVKENETVIDEATTAALQAFARRNQFTLNTVLQGAWALLLSRYSREKDVLFGVTVSGRPPDLRGAEQMVGLFINTLPLRVAIGENTPVQEWLKSIQAQFAEMLQYQYSPLIQVQNWSDMRRGEPIFESILVFENFPISNSVQNVEGSFQIANVHSTEQTNFPLNLVAGVDKKLLLRILYDPQRFNAAEIERTLGHLATILKGFIDSPSRPVWSVPVITPAEKHRLLVEWNQTAVEFPQDRCVLKIFEEQACRTPDAIAAVSAADVELSITYQELNQRANHLAWYLRKREIGPERLVGICMERSIDQLVAILAVFKTGGAYLPLDPTYPPERLAYMLTDSGASTLLTQQRLSDLDLFSNVSESATVVNLDTGWQDITAQPGSNLDVEVTPGSLAYVIYTSGSTGRPKGVLIEHRGLLNLVFWHQHAFGITAADRATQLAGQGFDASVWEIWPYLTAGASIYIPDDATRASSVKLKDWLVANRITVSFIPTPLAEEMLQMDWPESACLRYMLTGGDRLHLYPSQKMPFALVNNYGPTEDTVVSTSGIVPVSPVQKKTPAIGRPIDNTRLYVLDDHLQPVPIGIPGELYISGTGLARGYLNQPELTAEKFLANPFESIQAARMYRTGDLVRYDEDGSLEFLGRLDDQVKIRGFRIELGEIEAALSQHPDLQSVAVTAVPGPGDPGDLQLALYAVPLPGAVIELKSIREFLRRSLPEYMLPSFLVQMDSFPLTSNGKIDRKALPAPDRTAALDREIIEPRDLLEYRLRQIWEEVLNVHPISLRDNFFELGGHSLLAVRLMTRVKESLGMEISLAGIFQHPTIEEVAAVLRGKQTEQESLLVPFHPKGSRTPLFFVHPSGGSVHFYVDLVEALGPEQPFYGIQARGVNGDQELHTAIEEMAGAYVEAMLSIQPEGPYRLGSWSLGVIIAYEMAQQLVAMGKKVDFLALLDQGPGIPTPKMKDDAEYLVNLFGKEIPISLEELRRYSAEEQVSIVWKKGLKKGFIYPGITLENFVHFIKIMKTQTEAWRGYHPQPYPGRITLFRAREQDHEGMELDLGWATLAIQGVETILVPGDHLTMIHPPFVKELASEIHTCIQKLGLQEAV